jgi:hypothetical protein
MVCGDEKCDTNSGFIFWAFLFWERDWVCLGVGIQMLRWLFRLIALEPIDGCAVR